jgi:dolichol-phosphate mannosyltransferase
MLAGVIALNAFLFIVRLGMQVAVASSYDWSQCSWSRSLFFWLSPLADPLAVFRIILSASQRSIQWRGRLYSH